MRMSLKNYFSRFEDKLYTSNYQIAALVSKSSLTNKAVFIDLIYINIYTLLAAGFELGMHQITNSNRIYNLCPCLVV